MFKNKIYFQFKLLASKYLVDEGEDEEIYNEEWADLVDFPVEKVNKIERSILKQLVSLYMILKP